MQAGHPQTRIDAIEISYRLRRLGLTQARIAHALGVAPSVVSNTIRGRTTSHRVACYIAGLLGDDLCQLWPGRYEFKPRVRASITAPAESQSDRFRNMEGFPNTARFGTNQSE